MSLRARTKTDRRSLLLLGANVLALTACAGPLQITDGKKQPKGGIGGTGIVGTLTDFGSIIVNGLRIEVTGDTLITNAFGLARESDLAIGQSLTIEAAGNKARRIHIAHPVIGIVAPGATRDAGIVAGVPVTLEPGALGVLLPGARVAVSGIWRGTEVVASRVDHLSGSGPAVIAGEFGSFGAAGRPSIGGRSLASGPEVSPANGSYVTVTGTDTPEGFVIQRLAEGRFTGAAGPLVSLSVEGYLEPTAAPPFRAVSGLGHSFDPGADLIRFQQNRTIFTGAYEGTFVVQEGVLLPDEFGARRRLVSDLLGGTGEVTRVSAR